MPKLNNYLALIPMLILFTPVMAAAQFKDLPEDLGKMRVDGIDVSLWRSQTGKQLYYIPYIGMDWEFLQSNNQSLSGKSLKAYCEESSLEDKVELWKIKLNIDDKQTRENIVKTWNKSNRPALYYEFFDNGKVSLESTQMAPMVGYEIYLDLPKSNEYGVEKIELASEDFGLNGLTAYDGAIPVPFIKPARLSKRQICTWWEWRESALKGFIKIEALEYNNTVLSRVSSVELERETIRKIEAKGAKSIQAPKFSEGQVEVSKKFALTIISGAASLISNMSGGTLAPLAGIVSDLASGTVGNISEGFQRQIEQYENADVIITMLDQNDVSSIVQEISDSIIIQIGDVKSEEFITTWIDATEKRFQTLLENNTYSLKIETQKGSVKVIDEQSGEVALRIKVDGIKAGITEKFEFQIIDKSSFANVIRSRAAIFNATGVTPRPVAMASIDNISHRAEDWLYEKLDSLMEVKIAEIRSQWQKNLDDDRVRYLELHDSFNTKAKAIVSELSEAEDRSRINLNNYASSVDAVSEAARSFVPLFEVPPGTIIWWHPPFELADIPAGWAVADGRSVHLSTGELVETPNLMNTGIVGGAPAAAGQIIGSNTLEFVGESEGHVLTAAEMPKHGHKYRSVTAQDIGAGVAPTKLKGVRSISNVRGESVGGSKPHSHGIELSLDNRAASVVLVPLMKL